MQQVMTGIDDVDVFYFIMFFFCFLWEFMFLLINKDGLCYSGLQVHDGVVLNFVCHVQADWLSWVHTYYFSCSYTNLELWRAYRPACCLAMHAPQHIHKAIFDFMRTMCMHPMPCPTVKPHWLHEMQQSFCWHVKKFMFKLHAFARAMLSCIGCSNSCNHF